MPEHLASLTAALVGGMALCPSLAGALVSVPVLCLCLISSSRSGSFSLHVGMPVLVPVSYI
jgi:hypothetical protein